ncbi:MAG: hypothetical protein ACRD28_10505 [Acidobacteriaceae bacterium]
MPEKNAPPAPADPDIRKGAVEENSPRQPGKPSKSQESMTGQLGHRNADDMTSGNDTDFPEPGSNPEHTGEHK